MGPVFCVLSAAGFGLLAIFAKLAYGEGVGLDSLLVLRFGLAGVVLLVLAFARGTVRGLTRRSVLIGLAMGSFGYAVQAGLYFAALTRTDASHVALVFSIYPLLVMVVAVLIRRERASVRRCTALLMALAGIALVVGGRGDGALDPLGAAMALGSAVVYSGYILVGDRAAADIPPLALAALVSVGAFGTYLVAALARGGLDLRLSAAAWVWVVLLVLVSTVGAILLFFAGLARVGPSIASLLGIIEPVVTVGAASLVFGEALTGRQALGGVVVLAAVLLVQWPSRRGRAPERDDEGGRYRPQGPRERECTT